MDAPEPDTRAERFRLAWLSAKRRANRGWVNYYAAEGTLRHHGLLHEHTTPAPEPDTSPPDPTNPADLRVPSFERVSDISFDAPEPDTRAEREGHNHDLSVYCKTDCPIWQKQGLLPAPAVTEGTDVEALKARLTKLLDSTVALPSHVKSISAAELRLAMKEPER